MRQARLQPRPAHGSRRRRPKQESPQKPPRSRLDPKKHWVATVKTNCGTFEFELDVRHAPRTTASFAALAGHHCFDGTIFHRIVPGFVIQGGDPTQRGSGGPGYATVDKPDPKTRYVRGVVAMAKASTEPPGTAGSQFFVVTAADAQLMPDYAVLGHVTKGLSVVLKIGKLGNPATELPTQPIVISSIRVAAR